MKQYYPHQSTDSKHSADLRLQVYASADRTSLLVTSVHTSAPTICVARYRDMKRHDISISLLGYDINTRLHLGPPIPVSRIPGYRHKSERY